ncbi:hypothetical protein [Frankia sp. Cr2]|uniref:hypothetical protein n=1 Tax=Frankia sp. Cr2 TaxID=3073932 RepID=UPI002AD2F9E8|nr:hypothetical protein [Frankia sp. Cr2]
MRYTENLPRRGEFDYRTVVGPHRADPDEIALDVPLLGLPLSTTYLYGTLRDLEGDLFSAMRRIYAGNGGRERFLLQSTIDNTDLKVHPASRHSARATGVTRGTQDGTFRFESDPAAEGEPFHIEATATAFTWTEGDTLDLTGRLVPPGTQWHLPARERGMAYLSQLYEVEGTILGREVGGFLGMDDVYMHGEMYDGNDILVGDKAHILWYTWATRYTDGSLDFGHFLVGHEQLAFALLANEKTEVFTSHDIDAQVTFDQTGTWVAGIDLTASGQQWEFLPDPRGRMVDFMPMPNPQVEGRWRRVGDTREPLTWFAWGEGAPSHGDRRRAPRW